MKEKTKWNKYNLFLIGFVFAIMGCSNVYKLALLEERETIENSLHDSH
jgi:hypothetical protein